jgi:hypothetical protein
MDETLTKNNYINKETKFEQIKIKMQSKLNDLNINEDYKFEIGCNIIPYENDAICLNRNFENDSSGLGSPSLFRVDKINFQTKTLLNLFSKKEGPRFRLTNVNKLFK